MLVRRQALTAALAVTAADISRYFLRAVQIDPAQHTVTATDGNVALVVRDREPYKDADFPTVPGAEFHADPQAPFALDGELVKSMIAVMPKRATIPILETLRVGQNTSPTKILVAATDLQAPRIATIDMADQPRFPDINRVMPKPERAEVGVSFAVGVLEGLIKAAKAVNNGKKGLITIRFGVPTDATNRDKVPGTPGAVGDVVSSVRITITGTDGLSIDGVAMPVRVK